MGNGCPNCGGMLITDHGDFLTVVYCLYCDFEEEYITGPTITEQQQGALIKGDVLMESRLLKKKSKAGTEAAIQRAARHREAEVAAELAEVSSRLTETEGKLWSARQAEKNARGLAAYHQQQAAGYTQQLDRLTDDVAKMHKQVWRSSFVSFALGAALGLAIGFMCIPG